MEHFIRWKWNKWNGKDGKAWVNSSLNNIYLDLKFKNKECWIETLCGTSSLGVFGTGKKNPLWFILTAEPFNLSYPSWKSKGHKDPSPLQTWKGKFCRPHTVLTKWLTKHRSNTKLTQAMSAGKEQPHKQELKAEQALCGHLKAEINQDDITSAPIIMPWCSPLPSLCWSQPQLSPLSLMPQQTLFSFTQLPVPQESS